VSTTTSAKAKGAAGAWTAAILVILLCLLATFTIRTPNSSGTDAAAGNGRRARSSANAGGGDGSTDEVVAGDEGSAGSDVAGSTGGGGATGGSAGSAGSTGKAGGTAGSAGSAGKAGIGGNIGTIGSGNCGGQNKASDTGVSPTSINFAATVVTTGIAKDFLADAQYGMEAVRTKANRQGGVCGRQIQIQYLNDGWDQTTGQRDIQDFIGENKYFGLAVNPSSEGLRGAIDSGLIDNSKFPVIGSDGMLHDQYTDPWVWPVATSTASVMHIMAANAASRGAHKFGIVWDQHYRFGEEGHKAFVGEVQRLGGTVTSDVGVDGTQGDFANQAKQFVQQCGGTSFSNCDFVAMLLEPAAADSWVGPNDGGLGDGQHHPAVGVGVPQPLFVNSFVHTCGGTCSGMWAWTSFKPPLSPFDGEPAVKTYQADLAAVNQSADSSNPHVEGAYVGMLLLVDALTKLGANPTRSDIKGVLDNETLDVGLSVSPVKFSGGNHYGATGAQAFEDVTQGNSFANWRFTNVNANDASVGKDS